MNYCPSLQASTRCFCWRIVAINFLEQNELLPILASLDQMFLLAVGPIVHGLGLTYNDTIESWGARTNTLCQAGGDHTAHDNEVFN